MFIILAIMRFGGLAWMLWASLPTFLKQTLVLIVALVGVYVFAYGKGDFQGRAVIQARWDAAELAAIAKGSAARENAESSTPAVAGDPETPPAFAGAPVAPGVQPCRVRDRFDRECR